MKGSEKMSRFTKATLLIAGLVLTAAAEAALISGLFAERGGFFVGGEWLLPVVGVALLALVKQVDKLYRRIKED